MVTEISEDSVTAFYIFFLIKNYQRILDPNPLTRFFYFFVPQLLTKSQLILVNFSKIQDLIMVTENIIKPLKQYA